jgi:hypothetical protein
MSIWRACLLRLVIASAVLLPLAVVYGEILVNACLPFYRAVFVWVADDFKLRSLTIDREGVDRVIRAVVSWQPVVMINGKPILTNPEGMANSSTLLAHALHGPIVALLICIVWPSMYRDGTHSRSGQWLEFIARLLLLLPMLLAIVALDVPIVLAGELWSMAMEALDPTGSYLVVILKPFLQGGGRYALGIAAGLLAILIAHRIRLVVAKASHQK